MTLGNPQARRRHLVVTGPEDAPAERLSGLLVFCHYLYVRPSTAEVYQIFTQADPGLGALARDPGVARLVTVSSRSGESLGVLRAKLEPYLA